MASQPWVEPSCKAQSRSLPSDFAHQLTQQEFRNLISQTVISSSGYGGRRKLPWVVRVNIEIMRAFVRLRRLLATPGEIVAQLTKLAETVELHDDQIKVINEVLRKMMEPPPVPEKPKRRFGFHMPEPANDQAH